MVYTQKYTLVHFISPVDAGTQFYMSSWPLHTTLADVFAIDRSASRIDDKLSIFCKGIIDVKTVGLHDSVLGTTAVTILEKNSQLLQLHSELIHLLQRNGAKFNNPEFNNKGFIPHCTIQKNERLKIGQEMTINSVSLVDMFPSGDWQKRKVLATFNFK
jgi:2'-5' RNA ligase